jgi:hypothetical protein
VIAEDYRKPQGVVAAVAPPLRLAQRLIVTIMANRLDTRIRQSGGPWTVWLPETTSAVGVVA